MTIFFSHDENQIFLNCFGTKKWFIFGCSETSIASARASVMIYDDVHKRWIPSGTAAGLSKVHIFQHNLNNTFRVVGRKLQDHEVSIGAVFHSCQRTRAFTWKNVLQVVINCIILKTLKYNQATATFHQWRDSRQVYGLNFSSKDDADSFAKAMNYAVEVRIFSLVREVFVYLNSAFYRETLVQSGRKSILALIYLNRKSSTLSYLTSSAIVQ